MARERQAGRAGSMSAISRVTFINLPKHACLSYQSVAVLLALSGQWERSQEMNVTLKTKVLCCEIS